MMTSMSPDDQTKGRESEAQIDQEERAEFSAKLRNLLDRYEESSNSSLEEEISEKGTDEEDEHENLNNNIEEEELNGEEEEEEEDDDVFKSSEVKENMPMITCPECWRNFRSLKSLYGHLRSHPDRDYRGASKPPAPRPADKRLIISHWRTKRARTRFDTIETRENDDAEYTEIEIEVSKALLMLKRGVAIEPTKKKAKTNSPFKKKTRYNCNLCEKSFDTHQALGGHVASHNKHKNNNLEAEASDRNNEADDSSTKAAAAEHKCTNCGELFETGQALGGHKRRHYIQPRRGVESYVEPYAVPSTSMAPATGNARSKGLDIDLNEPWKPEDESEL